MLDGRLDHRVELMDAIAVGSQSTVGATIPLGGVIDLAEGSGMGMTHALIELSVERVWIKREKESGQKRQNLAHPCHPSRYSVLQIHR